MFSFAPAADQSLKVSGIGAGEPSCKSSDDGGEVATDCDGDAPGPAYRAIVTEQCARTNTSLETDPSTIRIRRLGHAVPIVSRSRPYIQLQPAHGSA